VREIATQKHSTALTARNLHAPVSNRCASRSVDSITTSGPALLQRKAGCACGGGCPSCQQSTGLTVSQPHDASEIEADNIADQVMRTSDSRSSGVHLDRSIQSFMQSRLGADFSDVRIHTDGKAANLSRLLNAQAFTVGHDIYFNEGRYQPDSPKGKHLLAHELTHTIQQGRSHPAIQRAPLPSDMSMEDPIHGRLLDIFSAETGVPRDQASHHSPEYQAWLLKHNASTTTTPAMATPATPATATERAPAKWTANAKDLLVFPLFFDIFSDIILKKDLTESERKQLKLKGYESSALFTWFWAGMLAQAGAGGADFGGSFGSNLSTWLDYTKALQPLTPHKDVLMDGLSTLFRLRVDDYLSSDLFMTRIKTHALSLPVIIALAQTSYSLYQHYKKPDPADEGKLVTAGWAKHTGLGMLALNKILLSEQTKAPGFFDFGPLQMPTHPGFSVSPLVGGKPPEGFSAEHAKGQGEGQGGQYYKFGGTLNLNKLVHKIAGDKEVKAEDMDDLKKYRKWQTSLWFNYERFDPTTAMANAGSMTDETFKGGVIFGSGGHLFNLEIGQRYGGEEARELTSFMFNGGYGYSGEKGSPIKRIGFKVTAIEWKEMDILAPVTAEGPTAGMGMRVTPFLDLEFGKKHKFGVLAALSLASGSLEDATVTDVRGGLTYTFQGNKAEGQLPQVKVEASASYGRLDWWDPNAARLFGFRLMGSAGRFHGGLQINTGAGGIGESRAAQIGEGTERGAETKQKALVPVGFLFSAGVGF
jgi:Domain of unknown function (DUF4157)